MKTYYDTIALGYNELHAEEQQKKMKIVQNLLSIKKTTKLLDVGCGSGISSNFECTVVGVDISKKLLDQCPPKKNCSWIYASAESLPFPNHFFDVVLCITAIHHFDCEKSITEMLRVGKQTFVISLLKKSKNYAQIVDTIHTHFLVKQYIDEEKDTIFLLAPKK